MKNLVSLIVLVFVVAGCNLSKYFNSGSGNANIARIEQPSAPKPSLSATPKPSATPPPAISTVLKKSVGKYPYDIKLMDNAELKARLKKLMGKDYAGLSQHFDVQSPIEVTNGIYRIGGCEQHNCGSNQYLIFVDQKNDNINVFHIEDAGTKHFFESTEIELPAKYAEEVSPPEQ